MKLDELDIPVTVTTSTTQSFSASTHLFTSSLTSTEETTELFSLPPTTNNVPQSNTTIELVGGNNTKEGNVLLNGSPIW